MNAAVAVVMAIFVMVFFWPDFYHFFFAVADVFGHGWADGVVVQMVVGSMIVMARLLGFFIFKVHMLGWWDGVDELRHLEQEINRSGF